MAKASKKTAKKAVKKAAAKKAAPKKKAAKKAPPKKAAPKKAAAKKAASKKPVAKKAAPKKAASKKAVPKKAAKKAAGKKAAPKRTAKAAKKPAAAKKKSLAPKKAAAKKAPVRKPVLSKAASKKTASKKPAPKKAVVKKASLAGRAKTPVKKALEKAVAKPATQVQKKPVEAEASAPAPKPAPKPKAPRKPPAKPVASLKPPKRTSIPSRDVRTVHLENDLRVISERVPNAKYVALGVYVKAGSRYEELNESGVTYLLQKIAFHGTKHKNANAIAKAIDGLGGNVDTVSERDYCAYTARVPGADLEKGLDLLTELSLYPQVTKTGFAVETKRALEELREDEEAPDFMLDRMFFRSFWKGHGLCRPPKGRLLHSKGQTKLENFKPKTIERYHTRSHHPKGLMVIGSGALDHDKFLKAVDKRFGGLEEPKKKVSSPSPTAFRFLALRNRPQFDDIRFRLGVPACNASEPERHPARLLNAILGGGPGSRLTHRMAEGVLPVIEAYSELDMFADAGCLSVRVQVDQEGAVKALETVVGEIRKLAFGDIGEKELDWAKAYCRSQLLEAVSSLESRVDDLARQQRYFQEEVSLEDEIAALENTKAERVRMLAAAWIAPHHLSLAVLGNLNGVNIRPSVLSW